jgi:hypothetical protein
VNRDLRVVIVFWTVVPVLLAGLIIRDCAASNVKAALAAPSHENGILPQDDNGNPTFSLKFHSFIAHLPKYSKAFLSAA